MPLQRIESEIDREEYGCAFAMRIAGTAQTVRIVISDEAAIALAPAQTDDASCGQLKPELSTLESLANEKFMSGRVSADGVVLITLEDVLSTESR